MTMKPNGKAIISSAGDTEQSKLGSHQRQSARAKPNGKSSISSDNNLEVISLNEISLGPQETELRFRLIHFWEVWNPLKKTLIGFEMPLIDEKVLSTRTELCSCLLCCGEVMKGISRSICSEEELCPCKRGKLPVLEKALELIIRRVLPLASTYQFCLHPPDAPAFI